jgi:hypothetical protein
MAAVPAASPNEYKQRFRSREALTSASTLQSFLSKRFLQTSGGPSNQELAFSNSLAISKPVAVERQSKSG